MSPYTPYGDPRLTPKWVLVSAGKGPLNLLRAVLKGEVHSVLSVLALHFSLQGLTVPVSWNLKGDYHKAYFTQKSKEKNAGKNYNIYICNK